MGSKRPGLAHVYEAKPGFFLTKDAGERTSKSKSTTFFPEIRANECVCSLWAKNQNMWNNKSEWVNWISMGEGKPSIVPSNPERHYRNQGTWVSWADFLGMDPTPTDPDSMDGAGI